MFATFRRNPLIPVEPEEAAKPVVSKGKETEFSIESFNSVIDQLTSRRPSVKFSITKKTSDSFDITLKRRGSFRPRGVSKGSRETFENLNIIVKTKLDELDIALAVPKSDKKENEDRRKARIGRLKNEVKTLTSDINRFFQTDWAIGISKNPNIGFKMFNLLKILNDSDYVNDDEVLENIEKIAGSKEPYAVCAKILLAEHYYFNPGKTKDVSHLDLALGHIVSANKEMPLLNGENEHLVDFAPKRQVTKEQVQGTKDLIDQLSVIERTGDLFEYARKFPFNRSSMYKIALSIKHGSINALLVQTFIILERDPEKALNLALKTARMADISIPDYIDRVHVYVRSAIQKNTELLKEKKERIKRRKVEGDEKEIEKIEQSIENLKYSILYLRKEKTETGINWRDLKSQITTDIGDIANLMQAAIHRFNKGKNECDFSDIERKFQSIEKCSNAVIFEFNRLNNYLADDILRLKKIYQNLKDCTHKGGDTKSLLEELQYFKKKDRAAFSDVSLIEKKEKKRTIPTLPRHPPPRRPKYNTICTSKQKGKENDTALRNACLNANKEKPIKLPPPPGNPPPRRPKYNTICVSKGLRKENDAALRNACLNASQKKPMRCPPPPRDPPPRLHENMPSHLRVETPEKKRELTYSSLIEELKMNLKKPK